MPPLAEHVSSFTRVHVCLPYVPLQRTHPERGLSNRPLVVCKLHPMITAYFIEKIVDYALLCVKSVLHLDDSSCLLLRSPFLQILRFNYTSG